MIYRNISIIYLTLKFRLLNKTIKTNIKNIINYFSFIYNKYNYLLKVY